MMKVEGLTAPGREGGRGLRIAASWGVLAALLLPGAPAWARDEADAASTSPLEWELLEAKSALGQGEPRTAASHYRGAAREAWFLLGLIAIAEGELEAARDALLRATSTAAESTRRARIAHALVQLRLGEVDESLRELRLAAQENLRDEEVLRPFVEALWATGREQELEADLERLRKLDPETAEVVAAAAAAASKAREPPFPDTGSLGSAPPEARERLRSRLAASLIRVYRSLAALNERTGFRRTLAELEAAAEALAQRYPDARDPFGEIELGRGEPEPEARLPHLDPTALLATEPPSLHNALALLDDGDFEGAEGELRRQLGGEDAAAARTLLGRLLAEQGRLEEAEDELLEATRTASEPPAAHQALARIYGFGEEVPLLRRARALRHLRWAAELGDLDRDLSLALADIELAEGRPRQAERQLSFLDKRFDSVEARLRLMELWYRAGRQKDALEAIERARRQAPNSEEVLLAHARLALEIGVASSAFLSVEPLVRMRPEVAEYRYLLGQAWNLRRRMGEASEAFLEAVELDPEYRPAFLPLGLALNHESRFEEAKAYLERHLVAQPEDLEALAALAESEERLGETARAEERALAVLTREPGHPRANLVLGMTYIGRGQLAEAREALRRAVEADPLLAKAHYQLSLACARLGEQDCAAEHLELYKKALQGPEGTYTQLRPAGAPALMTRREDSG